MTVKTAVPLADIEKTRILPRRTRSGQTKPECWGAKTTDGTWGMDREDEPGTPWSVTHLPTGIVADPCVGTLDDCRAYVASGQAKADLELILAHERGEHEAERDTSCPRC